jgi:hypothetical protein
VYESTRGSERDDDQAHRLLHELANDLAAIQMRADILISTTTTSEASTSPLVKADLVILRAAAEHAISTAEQFALVLTGAERPAIDGPDA